MLGADTCTLLWSAGLGALLTALGMTFWNRGRQRRNEKRRRPWGTAAKLYHTPSFMSSRCTWMVEELGVANHFEIQPYNPYLASPEEADWYRSHVNPRGEVPGLQAGGEVLTDSAAICMYLAEAYDGLLAPPGKEGVYYNWITHAALVLDPACRALYRQIQKTPEQQQDIDLIRASLQTYAIFVNGLNAHLETNDFLCGKKFTTADIMVGYDVMWVSVIKGGLLLQDYPNVKDYLVRLKARKAFKAGMGTLREWVNIPQWEPAAVTTEPGTVTTEPLTVIAEPATVTATDEPVTVTTQPVNVNAKSSTVPAEPVTVTTQSVDVNAKSFTVTAEPATVRTQPATVTTEPVTLIAEQ